MRIFNEAHGLKRNFSHFKVAGALPFVLIILKCFHNFNSVHWKSTVSTVRELERCLFVIKSKKKPPHRIVWFSMTGHPALGSLG